MTHLKHSSFSIAAAGTFGLLGLLFGIAGFTGSEVSFGDLVFSNSAAWIFTGLLFVLSYSALIHLKNDELD